MWNAVVHCLLMGHTLAITLAIALFFTRADHNNKGS